MIPHTVAEYEAWVVILLALYGSFRLATDVVRLVYRKEMWRLQRENQRTWRRLAEQKVELRKAQKSAGQTEDLEELF